ncbi:MAG: transglycosylase domain-containing protein, partial [Candidatus Korobacteraceae bacterium]
SLGDPLVKLFVSGFMIAGVIFLAMFTYFYVKYERIVDRRMAGPIFSNAARIYARPQTIFVGDKAEPATIAADLRRAGYSQESADSPIGHFIVTAHSIHITPGPESFHASSSVVIAFEDGKVATISENGKPNAGAYELEPELVTALFEGEQRSKREIITFNDIPKVMVDAVLAIEDRRFFQHGGVNYFRLMEAAAIDLRAGRHGQGASTITMQLSRGFFLSPEKTLKRKILEILIAFELEQKFSKQRIFEMYANQVYMGQRGSFTIAGFAEASHAYFNKDIKSLTLPEAALLAGMIQRPNYLSPYKNPKRALERRNLVLDSMVDTGAITREEAERAKATPLKLATPNVEASDAPYFVDMVKDQLSNQYSELELNDHAFRIYTTDDPDLQRAAAEAIEEGMKLVDEQVIKRRTHKTKIGTGKDAKTETNVDSGPMPQVALVALDPHTGEVLALVGGRNYGMSQLNHAIARRPTGSIFKPFVYAAAIDTALKGGTPTTVAEDSTGGTTDAVFTPATLVDDSPVSIEYGTQLYEPRNYKQEYHGEVTLRYALAMSLNNATVKVAQDVGFGKVAALAKAAGISSVRATPAIALGAYDATPLDMAGAYTVFANGGTRLSPIMVKSVRDSRGKVLEDYHTDSKPVLDPRVTYVLTTMMEGVVNNGTGYTVRARGFQAPAAGKTGTSHDAWFAGYTTNLLCIVWVGNDDYTDLKLSGSSTAAPIWAEFMKRAVRLPQYSDAKNFPAPSGVVQVTLDKQTNRLATPTCPQDYTVAFIAGTEPKETCDEAFTDHRSAFSKIFGLGAPPVAPPPGTTNGGLTTGANGAEDQAANGQPGASQQPQAKKKKGFFSRFFGRGDGSDDQPQNNGAGATENGNNPPPK